MVHPFDNIEVALPVEAQFIRFVQRGFRGLLTVARVAALPISRNGSNGPVTRHFADHVIVCVADVQSTIGSNCDAIGIVDLRTRSGASIAEYPR